MKKDYNYKTDKPKTFLVFIKIKAKTGKSSIYGKADFYNLLAYGSEKCGYSMKEGKIENLLCYEIICKPTNTHTHPAEQTDYMKRDSAVRSRFIIKGN